MNRSLSFAIAAAVLIFVGCRTHEKPKQESEPVPRGYLNTLDTNTPPSVIDVPRLQVESSKVLSEHRFLAPKILPAAGGVSWVVAVRSAKPTELDLAKVKIGAAGEVTVEISSYAYVGSDWAVVGPAFQERTKGEAAEIEKQIQQRYKAPPK